MKYVTLCTVDSAFDANFIKAQLERAGIICFLTNEHITNLTPNRIGFEGAGIQIMVHRTDADQALAILNDWLANTKVKCPRCGSGDLDVFLDLSWAQKLLYFLSLIVAVSSLAKYKYACKHCGAKFDRV
ncbi:MAG: DUF2007 domain-containing protein [Cyclobacteriaceae bacterium]|jgi:DNA-directed RNA polymerase subunit RPC12/RpoP